MDSVCLVVHLHGFYFDHYGGFKVREMGYCAVESGENGSYRYQMVRDVEQDLMDLYEQFRTDQRFRVG